MRQLQWEFKEMLRNNRDGSYATQAKRKKCLFKIAQQLHELGFNQMNVHALKQKHVIALIKHWQQIGYSPGTQQNMLTFVRWWSRKVGKDSLIPEGNTPLRIPHRTVVPKFSKAQYLSQEVLAKIKNERIRTSIELQQEFGLRRQESLLFRPTYADQQNYIKLKGSWTKGGRPREIPITTPYQRELLNLTRTIAGGGSMIPNDRSLVNWLEVYLHVLHRHRLRNLHGLRHGYAQRRYRTLTGWPSPFENGPKHKDMTLAERKIDAQTRLQVSRELGHNRIEITDVYLGKG